MIVTPKFWYKKLGALATLLSPLSAIYKTASCLIYNNRAKATYKSEASVICVGNVTMGGSGKTPVVEALYQILNDQDVQACVVSRGYGGSEIGPTMVDARSYNAQQVGDEAFMLAENGISVWVGKNRKTTVQHAEEMARVIILDDGFQNPSVHKTLSVLVFDGAVGIGNGKICPAGPLRENLVMALKRAQGVIIIGADQTGLKNTILKHTPDMNIFHAQIKPDQKMIKALHGKNLAAFAGIGRPDKFFDMLKGLNLNLVKTYSFADHKSYSEGDLEPLIKAHKDDQIVTTSKDFVRLPSKVKPLVKHVPIQLEFNDLKGFTNLILKAVDDA